MGRSERSNTIIEARALSYEVSQLEGLDGRVPAMQRLAAALIADCELPHQPKDQLSPHAAASALILRQYIDEDTAPLREELAVSHGRRTRPYLPEEYDEFAGIVDIAAARAYLRYARNGGSLQDKCRQQPGDCFPMTYILQDELRKEGIDTQHRQRKCTREGKSAIYHHFPRTIGLPVIFDLDPTWGQFMPEGTDYQEHPHTLIIPHPDIQTSEILAYHGIPEEKYHWWLAATPDNSPPGSIYGQNILWQPKLPEEQRRTFQFQAEFSLA